ncbi:MAG: preprotein translocase subunit YajC [Wolbachia endosymbiont of Menacanthus eurysternus]|nr:MAG: preprotein translocase subunit YajC [Wolbachia endosymbiont of Menacanthus eurysternus]
MFVSRIYAADTISNTSSFSASLANFIPLILIIIVFYFFIIRPHHKKLKDLKKMIDQIKRGDTIATSGGIIGIVNKIDEVNAQFLIEIAPKVEVKILKSAVSEVLNKEIKIKPPFEKNKIEKNDKKNKNQSDNKNKKEQNDKD